MAELRKKQKILKKGGEIVITFADKMWEEIKRLDEYSKMLEMAILRNDEGELEELRNMLIGK